MMNDSPKTKIAVWLTLIISVLKSIIDIVLS